MAAANPFQCLQDDTTCPICLDYYEDPVITECGHNFCRACIIKFWEGVGPQPTCPQCMKICDQSNLRPNRQLLSMAEAVKQLSLQSERAQEKNLCEKHDEKLKLFCKEDEKMICVLCRMSAEHNMHLMVPTEEAALQYKIELQHQLQHLRREMEDFLESKRKEDEEYRTMRI